MRKRTPRAPKPFCFATSADSVDQSLILTTTDDQCLFKDLDISFLKESGLLPAEAVIRPFDPKAKADFSSKTWICLFYYPFLIGLSYPFPPLIQEFFDVTGFSYSQVMPMVWRVLATVDRLNKTHGLSIGVPEIAATYNLRTHGSFCYCLQSKSSRVYMIPKVYNSDPDWKKYFFFVRRDSIPDGMNLPTKWVHKVVFEDLIKLRKDTKKRLKALFNILAEEREFWLEEETGEMSVIAEKPAESMNSGMPKPKSFCLVDLDNLIEDKPVVKQEHSKTLSPSVRVPTTRQKSAAQKKRKATTSAETEPFANITTSDAVEKLQALASFLGTKTESYRQISQDAELSKKETEAKLADLLQAIGIKDLLLRQKDKDISDLKASFESEKNEFLEDAKKCAAASILESMIKMSDEVQAKGYVMESWNSGAWKKKLKVLRGEKIEEDEMAGTSEVIKDAEASENVKETKAGETMDLEKKEGDDPEGEKA